MQNKHILRNSTKMNSLSPLIGAETSLTKDMRRGQCHGTQPANLQPAAPVSYMGCQYYSQWLNMLCYHVSPLKYKFYQHFTKSKYHSFSRGRDTSKLITLTPKQDKNTRRKENYRPLLLNSWDAEILNEAGINRFRYHMKMPNARAGLTV